MMGLLCRISLCCFCAVVMETSLAGVSGSKAVNDEAVMTGNDISTNVTANMYDASAKTAAGNGVSSAGNDASAKNAAGNGVSSAGNDASAKTSAGNGVSSAGNGVSSAGNGVSSAGNDASMKTAAGNDASAKTSAGNDASAKETDKTSLTGSDVAGANDGGTAPDKANTPNRMGPDQGAAAGPDKEEVNNSSNKFIIWLFLIIIVLATVYLVRQNRKKITDWISDRKNARRFKYRSLPT